MGALEAMFAGFTYTSAVRSAYALAITFALTSSLPAAKNPSAPVVRWTADGPNCTVRHSDDGRTYYGMSSSNFEVTLAVDGKELEKIPHRAMPMLAVLISFRYKGGPVLEVRQRRMALEFVNHRQVVHSSLEPEAIVQHLQENVDNLTDQVERHDVKKHPEQKEEKEAELQARLKDYTEMMDFISTQSLRYAVLNRTKPSISGWVFFDTKDRWIGPLHKPEQFVLRVPLQDMILEFPFSLPPKDGELELRRRSAE